MADTLDTLGGRPSIWHRPLTRYRVRDLLLGRAATRRNWRVRLRATDLPAEVRSLIERVVRRTRLWRGEKAGVADELVAHFADGVASGESPEGLIRDFGDERQAAKLIRRAKHRNRSLAWHGLKWCRRALAALVLIYAILFARFWFGRPTVGVDYVARLNAEILATPEGDRGWPIYREAIVALMTPTSTGYRDTDPILKAPIPANGGEAADGRPVLYALPGDGEAWRTLSAWLDAHADGIALVRRAAAKPSVGFLLGRDGSQSDPAVSSRFPQGPPTLFDDSLFGVLLPQVTQIRELAQIVSDDALLAATRGDGARATEDLRALLAMARQHDVPISTNDFLRIGGAAMCFTRVEQALALRPDAFTDAQLVALAHDAAGVGGDAPASLVSLDGERLAFRDLLQRFFTDDGSGDGRLTAEGVRGWRTFAAQVWGASPDSDLIKPADLALTGAFSPVASRAAAAGEFDRLMTIWQAQFAKPMREWDAAADGVERRFAEIKTSPLLTVRYFPIPLLINETRMLRQVPTGAERTLGYRDGVTVGIALELYRRRHGDYPATLDALAPQLLPRVPVDRITGEPVKYRLIDGKPVVYSVGVDRDDDGGRPVTFAGAPDPTRAAAWPATGEVSVHPLDGDWILFDARPDSK